MARVEKVCAMKLYVPISTDSNDSVKRSYAVSMITELAGCEVCLEEMGDSHADRACNKMANAFLKTDCDAMLIIDCDITFTKKDIARMIGHMERGHRAVWGLYPKKNEEAEPCVCTFNSIPVPDEHGLAVVRRSGRGFLLIHRSVFEALKEDNGGPALRFHNHGELQWSFFSSGVVTGEFSAFGDALGEDGKPLREWISEDWLLCEHLRKYLNIPCLVDTGIALGHVGSKTYRFAPTQLMRVDDKITSWRDIHGWFDYEDIYRDLVKRIPDGGNFVEVGCWLGRSIAAFHAFTIEAGKQINLYAVDTFTGKSANPLQQSALDIHKGSVEKPFRRNMELLGVPVNVRPVSSETAAWAMPFDFADAVFIDADHSEAAVRADIIAWLPNVKHGGILAGHDYDEPGVKAAVDDLLNKLGDVKTVGRCWVFVKP